MITAAPGHRDGRWPDTALNPQSSVLNPYRFLGFSVFYVCSTLCLLVKLPCNSVNCEERNANKLELIRASLHSLRNVFPDVKLFPDVCGTLGNGLLVVRLPTQWQRNTHMNVSTFPSIPSQLTNTRHLKAQGTPDFQWWRSLKERLQCFELCVIH